MLEFNVRLGDPETQPLMHRMDCDFVPALMAAAEGRLAGERLTWRSGPSVCVVLASAGYPGAYETGKPIRGIEEARSDRRHGFPGRNAQGADRTGNRRRPRAGRDGIGGRSRGGDR